MNNRVEAKLTDLSGMQKAIGEYERAFEIACDLLNGSVIYGIDADNIFDLIMQEYGVVSAQQYQRFILNHLDRFSDDDEIRLKAVERLGW